MIPENKIFKIKSSGNLVRVKVLKEESIDLLEFNILSPLGAQQTTTLEFEKGLTIINQLLDKSVTDEIEPCKTLELQDMDTFTFISLFPNFPFKENPQKIIDGLVNFKQLHLAIALYGTDSTYDILKEFNFNIKFKAQFK